MRNLIKLTVAGAAVLVVCSACGLFDQGSPPAAQQQSDHTTVISTGDNSAMWVLLTVMVVAGFGFLFWAMNEKGRRERAEDHAAIQSQLARGDIPVLNGRPYVGPVHAEWDPHRAIGR